MRQEMQKAVADKQTDGHGLEPWQPASPRAARHPDDDTGEQGRRSEHEGRKEDFDQTSMH